MQDDKSALEFFDAGMGNIVKVFESVFNTEGWVVDSFRTAILNVRESFVLVFKRRCDAFEKFQKGIDRMAGLITKMMSNGGMKEYMLECTDSISYLEFPFKNILITLGLKYY